MPERDTEEKIARLRRELYQAWGVVVLTGAGVSAESGVPTFRGLDGLWRTYRATDLATPEAFAQDPELVWEFYHWRRELLSSLKPNAAHRALAALEPRIPQFTLITQNIDGLHQAAGSRNVIELHGNIWWVRCTMCGKVVEDRTVALPKLPACAACGGLLRPHVVWFGEALETAILNQAYELVQTCQVMLIVGTSAVVQPAASLGLLARRRGALVAEINLEPTPYTEAYNLSIQGKAGDLVPRLL